jgi:DNA helicase HerA-like ATPase
MTTGNSNGAKVIAIMGSTGCGKSHFLRLMLAKRRRKRTLIWSPKEAIDNYAALYPGSQVVTTAGETLAALKAAGKGEFHLVFKPRLNRKADEAQFGAVCKIAMLARNVTFIGEEIHTVTKPSWAPDGWSELIMMGRGYGAEVFGLSQRPASVDKDFFGNISMIHVGRMAYDDDAKVVGKALGVTPTDVLALTGHQWIERDILTGKITRGG